MDAVDSPESEEVNDDYLALEVYQLEGLGVDPLGDLGEVGCRDVELSGLTCQ